MSLLNEPNAFRITGVLGSMPEGNGALVYLFIVLSKGAPFCQRNMVSTGRPLISSPYNELRIRFKNAMIVLKAYLRLWRHHLVSDG